MAAASPARAARQLVALKQAMIDREASLGLRVVIAAAAAAAAGERA